jgi:hypothetical protein
MAANYTLVKSFAAFKGLDLRSGDLLRLKEFSSGTSNCDFRSTSALSKRKGVQTKASGIGQGGISTWSDLNTSTGEITNKIVAVDSTLHVLESGTMSISYAGSGIAYYTMESDGTEFIFTLIEDDTIITQQQLGTGLESSPTTIADLSSAIDSQTDFTSSVTGTDTVPAAFLDVSERADIGASIDAPFKYYSTANSPSASAFTTHWDARNDDDFEPASFVSNNGVIYIANGKDELHKYDGQNLYRAGMPEGAKPSAVTNGAGSVTNASLDYWTVYYQVDNKGNIVEGKISNESTSLSASSNTVDVTVNNLEASSGFNTNCAIVAGTQSSVTTITVDDGSAGAHTMLAGDTAYFYDAVSASYVTRTVNSVTASSITISGAAVTVNDNEVISNNLRIDLYRNQSSGTTPYLVESIPNNSFASTQVYTDNKADAALGEEYVAPIKERGLPPKGRYITLFRNQLIIGGFDNDVDAIAYSDSDSPEYFPSGTNRFNVDTAVGDKVTGVKALNSVLYVFKGQTIHTVTGDLINDNFQVDILTTGGVGCQANATISEVNGQLFFLDKEGVFAVSQGADGVVEVSELISPEFDSLRNSFNFKRATAAHWLLREKYVLYMPIMETNGGEDTAASTSVIFAYDIFRGGWLKWNSLNALGGMTILDEDLFISRVKYDTSTSAVSRTIDMFLNTGTSVDYADHEQPISAEYKTHWESLGEPSVFKKFNRLKLHSLDASVNDFETQLFKVTVVTEHDFNDVPVYTHVFDFGNGSTAGWGENPWGEFPWGDARLPSIKTKLKSTKARTIRLTFSNDTLNQNFLLSGYEFEVAAPYRMAIKE